MNIEADQLQTLIYIQLLSTKLLQEIMNREQEKFLKLNKQNYRQPEPFPQNSSNQNVPSFLLKTYEILQTKKYRDIMSWTVNGEGFVVKKIKQLAETVLPVFFRHNNYTSFVRQLNMYDFHKTRQQNHENAFKNFLFKKGHRYLLKQIQRKDYKKNKQSNKELYSSLQKQITPQPFEAKSHSQIKLDTCQSISSQNQCFMTNITELEKARNMLQEKSLKIMCFKQGELTNYMITKAIDVLFDCGFATKRAFNQIQVLKIDYQINGRKDALTDYKDKFKTKDKGTQIFKSQKMFTQLSLSCSKQPLTETKTMQSVSSQSKASFSGFQRFGSTQISLFNSFRND